MAERDAAQTGSGVFECCFHGVGRANASRLIGAKPASLSPVRPILLHYVAPSGVRSQTIDYRLNTFFTTSVRGKSVPGFAVFILIDWLE